MKILLCARSQYSNLNSSDTDIIFNIYSFLKKRNIDVDICGANEEVDYGKYDIAHLFDINNIYDTYKHFKLATNSKCKIIVTPMYFNLNKFLEFSNNVERQNSWNNCKIYRELILKKSSLILCSSEYEKNLIEKDFNLKGNLCVVYNGVKVNDEEIPLYDFKGRYNLDNYVLSVGRISEIKNQLTLSRVCGELKVPLVLIGPMVEREYLKQCLSIGETRYLGFMKEYDLYNAYTFSKSHILASFSEVTSISSLKAASYGCNVVVTEEGGSKEYFKDQVTYCNPYDYESIKEAVKKSISVKKNRKLREYVRINYNLAQTLENIYKHYL